MQFPSPLIKGTLIKRYKRFLADVERFDGTLVVAHCPNTGAMTGCAEPGYTAWLRASDDPKRKLAYTWELCQNDQGHWIGINTHNANKVVGEALEERKLSLFASYTSIKPEVKYGEQNSRIDFLLTASGLPDCYVEVKSVTLLRDKIGYFPDAKTQRGTKHLQELTNMVKSGSRCVLLYCVQHTGIKEVTVAHDIDPEYYAALQDAHRAGVEIVAYSCNINEEKIELNQPLNFIPQKKG
ncbi:DNA/RNA nuclease SfsA [Aliiglaciecola sp. M165]|uniref:DNA/RNA nuclease SfsA n=1 Tax=Aliiglaciecola sp. M165 TaxID=2593649 RepID=UPI00117C9C1C|nr:DNA/RNA nuclease SfsA [Aliiglaciecola sp. M165]TRY33087.1 DNA/RNA nuclease SfsA [Aliiglaciecola sp. M165]